MGGYWRGSRNPERRKVSRRGRAAISVGGWPAMSKAAAGPP